MKLQSRAELKDYCLRKLGQGLIKINVSDEQIEDRIDDSLLYYMDFHSDGMERLYLKHEMSPSVATLSNRTGTFQYRESVVGSVSGATAKIWNESPTDSLDFWYLDSKRFEEGETLTGNGSGATATLDSVVLGDVDNQYITIGEHILSVIRILPMYTLVRSGASFAFDPRYQMILDNMRYFNSYDLTGYTMMRQHLNMLQEIFVGKKPIDFNRNMGRLFIRFDWRNDIKPRDVIIIECWSAIDPLDWPNVYNDMFVREYTTALIKQQWGQNLSKFDQIQLPGGTTLNGDKILEQANQEIDKLRERMHTEFTAPLEMFIG